MADRYWVGGTANWDGTAGTKWALTSGGLGGQAVPTSADDVFFDAASTGTCTISTGNTGAKSINCTGFTGTLAGTADITVSGSITLAAGMTVTYSSAVITVNGTGTLTTAGKSLFAINVNGVGITVTLGDALTLTQDITVTNGIFTTNNYNLTARSLQSANSNIRTITLGSSTVSLSRTISTINFTTNTNLTFNANTSVINITSAPSIISGGPTTGTGVTFYNVSFTSTSTTTHEIQSANTFNNITVTATSSAGVTQVTFNSRQTINGTLSTTGTAGNRRVWFQGATYGIAQTLTINATPSLTDADFRDIYVVGTAAPISGTRIGDLRGCRGITFSAPKTVYWNLAGAQNWSANGWATTSTGTPSTDNFPLAQDTATFTNAGSVTGQITMDSAVPYTGTVDMAGRTSAMTINVFAGQIVYGNWLNGSGTTLSGTNSLTFSGRNTQTITSAGKTFSQPITIDSYGGSVELADALNIGSQTLTVTNGTFDTKNFNVTAGTLSSSNQNVRSIKLGSSTVTLSSAFTVNQTPNLTFNAGTSQITINPASNSTIISGGNGYTFYNVTITPNGASAYFLTITGQNTFNNLTCNAKSSDGLVNYLFAANQTITGTLTCSGSSPVRRVAIISNTLNTAVTLTANAIAATDCDFRDITIAGVAAGSSPTRAGNCGGNSGITFPAPKTVYWNLAGTQNWSATGWCPTSGGTPNINEFPLAQDTAVLDDAGTVGTITFNQNYNIGTFDASARTSAATLTFATDPSRYFVLYKDWKNGTGLTFSNSASINASGATTQTITSAGKTFGNVSSLNSQGILTIADAIVITSTLAVGYGTFDAATYNVTAGSVTAGTGEIRTLKMGTGTWTLTGTGTVWDLGSFSITNQVLYKNTANIVLSNTSSSARTFEGRGLSYNKLTIGGSTGISTLTINDNNQFTELASTKTVAHTIALGSTTQTFGKWTVTGTAGNVVTLTGSGTGHVIAGACTSGIDYLAMGGVGFAATSPGEFYAGANSTGSAGAPVYRTAKPADSTRYWVGGTGNWSDTARWSTGSGGLSGASVPRSHDDVVFDSLSNATAYTATVDAVTGGIRMKSLTIAGPATGNVTLAGTTAMVGIHGNVTLPATGLTRTYTGAMTLSSNSTGLTFTTNGVSLNSNITVNGVDCAWALGSALDMGSSSALTVTNGSVDLATYNLTASSIVSNVSSSRTVDFGTGTTQLSAAAPINFGTTETNRANLTVTAGTSQINSSLSNPTFSGNNQTFYNVSFTGNSAGTVTINGSNSFNNLSFTGITSAGLKNISLSANQTVTGTLTFSAGTNATMRHFVRSNTIGTTRTLTVAAFSGTDVDFRDITIAGAAAPVSGTRLGDCKGNSGITFVAGKTVYVRSTGSANWSSSTGWSATEGSAADVTQFPLAQDTVIFPAATYPSSGSTITVDQSYNIGTIDMSARTANTVTLATGSTNPIIYGNWINGTGTTLTSTGVMTFAGRGAQTITSAGKAFTQIFTINSPAGSLTLQDALTLSVSSGAHTLDSGTFDASLYNVTISGGSGTFNSSNSNVRTIAIGSGTWSIAATGSVWSTSTSTNLTVTGTGTISLTSASAKTFAGGGIAYTNITLNQGGNGTLTITGNNTFKTISSTAAGANTINIGTTTQRITTSWTATGTAGNILTVQGTSASSPGTLIFTGSGTAANVDYLAITGVRAYSLDTTWYAGANSTNNGSLGWYFQSGGTTVTASVSETSTASDSISALGVFGGVVSELATISDSVFAGFLYLSDIAETVTGLDSIDAVLIFNRSVDESAIAADSISTIATLNPAIAELVTGTDTVSSLGVFNSSVLELSVAADQVVAGLLLLSNIQESSVAADSVSVTLTLPADISETSTALDVVAAQAVFPSSISELATAADSDVGFITFPTSINETSTASETATAAAFFVSNIIESANSTDTTASLVTFGSLINEFVQTLDTFLVAASIFNAPFSDSATASDSDVGFITFPTVIDESATAADEDVGFITFPTSINETSTALDTMSAVATFVSAVSEQVTGIDSFLVAPSIFNVVVPESAVARDVVASNVVFVSSISELVAAIDLFSGAYLWTDVDDSQGAIWANVNNSQGSVWTPVNNSQGATWTNVNNSQGGTWTDVNDSQGAVWSPVIP